MLPTTQPNLRWIYCLYFTSLLTLVSTQSHTHITCVLILFVLFLTYHEMVYLFHHVHTAMYQLPSLRSYRKLSSSIGLLSKHRQCVARVPASVDTNIALWSCGYIKMNTNMIFNMFDVCKIWYLEVFSPVYSSLIICTFSIIDIPLIQFT